MIDHDQSFKKLLTSFFGDFLHLVAPDVVPALQLDRVSFLESEQFTDALKGSHRHLDLVAQVETRAGDPEIVLVHIEIESQARKAMDRRMWRYAMTLRLRHDRPVVPIVLYLRGGPPGVEDRVVEERFGDRFLGSFVYLAFGLSLSDAERYLQRPERLAWGLAALMGRGRLRGARKKLACMTKIQEDRDLDDARRFLLVNCVETYVQLTEAEQEAYETLLADEANREVKIMEMTWADRMRQEGEQKGLQKGMQKGLQEGLEEGLEKGRVEGMQALLLDILRQRFGAPEPKVERHVRSITSAEELSRLAGEVLEGRRPPELGR